MFGEELKAQGGNFVHYFLLNIPLLTLQSATQLIRIFFSRYLLDHLLYRLQLC